MTDRWHNFFVNAGALDRSWLGTAAAHWSFSERLRGNLVRLTPDGGRILEVGCGPGFSGLLLNSLGYRYTGVDNEPRLVELATSLARQMTSEAQYEIADAKSLAQHYGQFDVAFSSGVLEHFDRHETIKLLREQARCARVVVISIPTRWTRYTGTITDERFYSVRQLREIAREAQLFPIRSFGYGDITATRLHLTAYRLLPMALLRFLQDRGYSYAIAVAGQSKLFRDHQLPDAAVDQA